MLRFTFYKIWQAKNKTYNGNIIKYLQMPNRVAQDVTTVGTRLFLTQ